MRHTTHLSPTPRDLDTSEATSTITSPDRTFLQVWARTGAPALVGYESSLLAASARTDMAMYEQVTTVDLDDPDAVLGVVEAIQDWRQDVAAGNGPISFGPRTSAPAKVHAVDLTHLPQAA